MLSPPKTKLDDREIDRSAPQFASSHAMIWSSRLPKPSGGTAILTLTGNRRSASRGSLLAAKGDRLTRSAKLCGSQGAARRKPIGRGKSSIFAASVLLVYW
jgi:hypothetical protein